jgi:prophage tail gpP-like protein
VSLPLASDLDEVVIQVGSTQFKGWQTVTISRSCESMPNSFAVSASGQFLQGADIAASRPGQKCLIYIGSDLVITGWIDRRSISLDAHNHLLTISGRGITRNLVDCSADLVDDPDIHGGMINGQNTLGVAQGVCKAYGITAISAVADYGVAIPQFQVQLSETPYTIIEGIARYAGYLVYEDTFGRLVLDRVGTNTHASGFSVPGNVEAIHAERSVDQRYSQYLVVWFGVDQLSDLGSLLNRRAVVDDGTLGEKRLKIIVSEQIAPPPSGTQTVDNDAIAKQRANWEMARRIGRSSIVSVTCDSWRDSKGTLWTPNWLAPVAAPAADIVAGGKWIIGSVTYRKDMSGTHADLVLMPPDAFIPDPNPLNLFDYELVTSPRTSQNPAPPSTNPPPT